MSDYGLTPLTELDAINWMLATGAETPITSIDDVVIDASLAKTTLRNTSIEVQTRGWNFNSEENWKLTPDQAGHILLPANVLRLDTVGESAGMNCVTRGPKLYNKTDHTYEFANAVTVDMVVLLPFDELPSAARLYITIKAARRYQDQYFGDPTTHTFVKDDETLAYISMMDEEIESGDYNMLTGSQFNQTLTNRG